MTSSFLAATIPLLAAGEFLTAWIPDRFLFHVGVIAAALLLLWLGVNWVERWRGHLLLSSQSPRTLFRELCRVHALTRTDRQRLAAITQTFSPEQSCRIFIDPRVLEEYARSNPAEAEESRYFLRRLFGSRSE